MKAAAFDYVRPGTSEEVVGILAENEDAKILAGGQSLVPLLNMRLARPTLVVDVNGLEGLDRIQRTNGRVAIGALARHRDVETSPVVQAEIPLLAQAMRYVGHVTIRNRGTIGGSIAHSDPAAELPAVAVAMDADVVVRGPRGERTIAARDFFLGYLMTALEPDEMIIEIRMAVLPPRTGCAVEELARRSGDFALVAVFVSVTLSATGQCEGARITVAGAGPAPVRASDAENVLQGAVVTEAAIAAAAAAVAGATDPPNDIHAPAEYRRQMVAVLSRRAIQHAVNQANRGA